MLPRAQGELLRIVAQRASLLEGAGRASQHGPWAALVTVALLITWVPELPCRMYPAFFSLRQASGLTEVVCFHERGPCLPSWFPVVGSPCRRARSLAYLRSPLPALGATLDQSDRNTAQQGGPFIGVRREKAAGPGGGLGLSSLHQAALLGLSASLLLPQSLKGLGAPPADVVGAGGAVCRGSCQSAEKNRRRQAAPATWGVEPVWAG